MAAVIILSAAFGYMLSKSLSKPVIIQTDVPVLVQGKDSVIIKKYYYAVHDTIEAVVKNDTAKTSFSIEKVFDKDTLRSKTDIKYSVLDSSFNIDQSFDLIHTKDFRVDTLKLKIPYPVEKDLSFFEEPYVNFILGVIASVAIFFLSGG